MKTIGNLSVHLAGALGPDLMLELTSRHGTDQWSSWARFGPQAGLCRPPDVDAVLQLTQFKIVLLQYLTFFHFAACLECVSSIATHLQKVEM